MDQFLLVKDGKLEFFDGDLDDYEKLLMSQSNTDAKKAPPKEGKINKKELRQQAAEKRNQLKLLRDTTKKLEQQLNRNQDALVVIEKKLADSSLYEEAQKVSLNSLLLERAELVAAIENIEEQWLRASEELESQQSISEDG